MVFWREMGWKEEDDAVDALEGVCNMTDMFGRGNRLFVRISLVVRSSELPLARLTKTVALY